MSIYDLHCDLLCYLAGDVTRSAYDPCVRCSLPQLQAGNVKLQVMPIFVETEKHSAQKGTLQAEIFARLPEMYPKKFQFGSEPHDDSIQIHLAIENASSFSDEDEPLDLSLQRLLSFSNKNKIVYISLTWNTENRFGGGARTSIGLKADGQMLLDFLHQKNIAVDLSHASDELAYDIFNYIDAKSLLIPIIASHSNMRSITSASRNLPDDIAQEIFRRKGIIGFNFVRFFIGSSSPSYFSKQLEHMLALGGDSHICFGADFFYGEDVSPPYRKPADELFFPEFSNAAVYGKVLHLWEKELKLSREQLEKIAFRNLRNFLNYIK